MTFRHLQCPTNAVIYAIGCQCLFWDVAALLRVFSRPIFQVKPTLTHLGLLAAVLKGIIAVLDCYFLYLIRHYLHVVLRVGMGKSLAYLHPIDSVLILIVIVVHRLIVELA